MGEVKRLGFRLECRSEKDSGVQPECNRECIGFGKICVDLRIIAEEVSYIRILRNSMGV